MATKSAKSMTLQDQAQEILAQAEEKGVSSNFFFATTFHRYQVQMKILQDLQKEITEQGTTVRKEYVKGRANLYTNPAIREYNNTATAANGTVATLINIVNKLSTQDAKTSKMTQLLDGLMADE